MTAKVGVESNKTYLMKTYLRDLKTKISFMLETSKIFVSCCEKLFIYMSTWMAG